MTNELLFLLATLAIVFYVWQRRTFGFWQRRGVKFLRPLPLVGSALEFLTGRVSFFQQLQRFHDAPGFEKEPYVGVFMSYRPALVIRDLGLIKTVMIKKFQYFTDRVLRTDPHNDALGHHNLFFSLSPAWKVLRNRMSPVFTSGKTKQMYPLMVKIGQNLENSADRLSSDSIVQVKDLCGRFTTDMIATIAFGVEANALQDLDSEFFKHNKGIFGRSLSRAIDFGVILLLPALASLTRAKLFPRETAKFIRSSISFVVAERERTGVRRNDLIDTLLAWRREAAVNPGKHNLANDLDYLVAQAAVFQTAGFETSSSTMTMTLYEMALNPELQDRLRQEIVEYFGEEDHISYERIQEMPYLSQVVDETLRKYPIVPFAERMCAQPKEGEKFTLSPFSDIELPHGTAVYVSLLAIHRDPQYWPEPEKFDPERFAPENRHNINMDAYMPFGVGPRNCIGMRLGLLETKLGLVHLLHRHRVHTCDQTIKKLVLDPIRPVLASKTEIALRLEKVSG